MRITASPPNTQNLLKLHSWQKASHCSPLTQREGLPLGPLSPGLCRFLFQIMELLRPLKRTIPIPSDVNMQLPHHGFSPDRGVWMGQSSCPPIPNQPHGCCAAGRGKGPLYPVCWEGGWLEQEMGALGLSGHELSGLPRGKETRISCKQLGGFLSALDVLRGHSPCDSWGFPGALELGGAGMSDSGEASSCSGQEEMVRIFTPTKFLGQSRSRRGADPQGREPGANDF